MPWAISGNGLNQDGQLGSLRSEGVNYFNLLATLMEFDGGKAISLLRNDGWIKDSWISINDKIETFTVKQRAVQTSRHKEQ